MPRVPAGCKEHIVGEYASPESLSNRSDPCDDPLRKFIPTAARIVGSTRESPLPSPVA